jgi:hypothetical protein
MLQYYGITFEYAVRRWPKRRYAAHDYNICCFSTTTMVTRTSRFVTYIARLLVDAYVMSLPVVRIYHSSLRRHIPEDFSKVSVHFSNRFVFVMEWQCVLRELRAVFRCCRDEFQVWKVYRLVQTFFNRKQWLGYGPTEDHTTREATREAGTSDVRQ